MVGALSLATDLGTERPLEHTLRTAVLAVHLGELAGASAQELADTYYVALLYSAGAPRTVTKPPSPAETIGANFDEHHVDPSEYVDEGDRVVVAGQFKGKNKGGALLDTGFTHIFDMRGGKVVRFENKPDDEQAWAASWTS